MHDLTGVKAGDRLVIMNTGRYFTIKPVERVTPTGGVVVRYSEQYVVRFRPDGRQQGQHGYYRSWARPATAEDEAKFVDQQNFNLLRSLDWSKVTPAKRAACIRVLREEQAHFEELYGEDDFHH